MGTIKRLQDLPLWIGLFLILASIITLLCGLVFVTAQQIHRQNANDPQIQISEDMANYLSQSKDITSVMPKSEVDIAKSLVWFVMDFDDNGEVKAANAKLDGQTPVVPKGVLEHAKRNGQNRVTWEPKEGVRIATVVTGYEGGTLLIGRSLRETDARVLMLHKKIFSVWVLALAITFAGTWLLIPRLKKSH